MSSLVRASQALLSAPGSSGVAQTPACEVLSLAWNQEATHLCIGTTQGLECVSLNTQKSVYSHPVGAISVARMLYSTSLVAYVGAGHQPSLSPRTLTLRNTAAEATIQELSFSQSVLSICMNKTRLVVVLFDKACVYSLQTLALLATLTTPKNPQGVAALSSNGGHGLLVLPAGETSPGTFRVYSLSMPTSTEDTAVAKPEQGEGIAEESGSSVLCECTAHKAALQAVAMYHDDSLLASVSTKGTVIRVFSLPQATQVASFRRGSLPATVHSMAWSPPHIYPPLLAASSSRSVHIFRLDGVPGSDSGVQAGFGSGGQDRKGGILSVVRRLSISNMVEPQRGILSVRLHGHGVPSIVALVGTSHKGPSKQQAKAQQPCDSGQQQATAPKPCDSDSGQQPAMPGESGNGPEQHTQGEGSAVSHSSARDSSAHDSSAPDSAAHDPDSVMLLVATLDGLLYKYRVAGLHGPTGSRSQASCSEEGEWNVVAVE